MVNPFYKIQIFDWVLQSWPQKHFNVNRPIRLIRFLIKLSKTLRNLSFNCALQASSGLPWNLKLKGRSCTFFGLLAHQVSFATSFTIIGCPLACFCPLEHFLVDRETKEFLLFINCVV